MDQVASAYRAGLIGALVLLLLVVIGFGAITVIARDRWLSLGLTESLVARLAAAAVAASVGVSGLSGVILNFLYAWAFTDTALSPATARTQAVLGIGVALSVSTVAIIRIEMYHRRLRHPPTQEEDSEWKVEPPELAGRR